VKGLSLGLPAEFFDSALDDGVRKAILKTIKLLEEQGASAQETALPGIKHAVPAYYLISSSEASANLARYDGIRYGHRSKAAKNIDEVYRSSRARLWPRGEAAYSFGNYALSSGYHDELYNKALKVRRIIANEFARAFEQFDVIIGPAYPTTAFKLGEKLEDPLKMYLSDIYTAGVNLAGLPGLVVPCGLDDKNMPIGIQLIGKPFSEKLLLRIGYAIEKAVGSFKALKNEGRA
jgi:aspartyl-tRNA(Asn)/glutamyl-tRNA(Gln) amidotransferase subunit A